MDQYRSNPGTDAGPGQAAEPRSLVVSVAQPVTTARSLMVYEAEPVSAAGASGDGPVAPDASRDHHRLLARLAVPRRLSPPAVRLLTVPGYAGVGTKVVPLKSRVFGGVEKGPFWAVLGLFRAGNVSEG